MRNCMQVFPEVRRCLILCALSDSAHASQPNQPLRQDALQQYAAALSEVRCWLCMLTLTIVSEYSCCM